MAHRYFKAVLLAALIAGVTGCAQLEEIYRPADTVALKGPPALPGDIRCSTPDPATPPSYEIGFLKDCTSPDTFIVFAFSGGGTPIQYQYWQVVQHRSSFGYHLKLRII